MGIPAGSNQILIFLSLFRRGGGTRSGSTMLVLMYRLHDEGVRVPQRVRTHRPRTLRQPAPASADRCLRQHSRGRGHRADVRGRLGRNSPKHGSKSIPSALTPPTPCPPWEFCHPSHEARVRRTAAESVHQGSTFVGAVRRARGRSCFGRSPFLPNICQKHNPSPKAQV